MRLPLVPMLPINVVLQAIDDLHALAEAARRLPTIEAMLTEQFALLNTQADRVLELGERIVEQGERLDSRAGGILELGERVDARASQLLVAGESLNSRAAEILRAGDRLDGRATDILDESHRVRESAREVADRGAEVAAALPALQQIVTTTEPLQGAIERFGRIVDRLPGGERRP